MTDSKVNFTKCEYSGDILALYDTVFAFNGRLFKDEHACMMALCDKGASARWARQAVNDEGEYVATMDVLKDECHQADALCAANLTAGQRRIAAVLMKRDDIRMCEAYGRIKECVQACEDCEYDTCEVEDIMADYLGLEPDYCFDLFP